MELIYNGKFIEEKQFSVGMDNRAFTYGDGVFETIIAIDGKATLLPYHYERLTAGIKALGMLKPATLSLESLKDFLKALTVKNKCEEKARIKIIVWRKSGGLFSPTEQESEYMITATPHTSSSAIKEKAVIIKDVRTLFSPFSRYKTLSSLPYVMAGLRKNALQADDVILFDSEHHVSECLVSNIFWISGNKVYTPSLFTGCKDGIMRRQILDFLTKATIEWVEGQYKEPLLLQADFVFTSNVAGIVPVRKINDRSYPETSEVFTKIREHFQGLF